MAVGAVVTEAVGVAAGSGVVPEHPAKMMQQAKRKRKAIPCVILFMQYHCSLSL